MLVALLALGALLALARSLANLVLILTCSLAHSGNLTDVLLARSLTKLVPYFDLLARSLAKLVLILTCSLAHSENMPAAKSILSISCSKIRGNLVGDLKDFRIP